MSTTKPRLFIHIGSHKTGSPAIQQTFRSKETGIEAEGLIRIECSPEITKKHWEPKQEKEFKDHLHQHLVVGRETYFRYLISYEGYCGNAFQGYPDASVIASRLKAVTHDFDVKIIVFLRRQDDFIESMYTQMIHQGGSRSFQDFISTTKPETMNWHRLLESYAEFFGRENLIVRRYHAAFYPKSESLIEDFGSIVGVKPESLNKRSSNTRNQGYSSEAVDLARLCNPVLDKGQQSLLREILQEFSPKPIFKSYSYLDLETRRRILASCAESNDQVRRDYFNDLGSDSLFPEPEETSTERTLTVEPPLTARIIKEWLEQKEAQRRSLLIRLVLRFDQFWRRCWKQ